MIDGNIGIHTHRLIAEDFHFNVSVLGTGSFEYCSAMMNLKLAQIERGELKLKQNERMYIAELMPDYILFGPPLEYKVLGQKI